MARKKNGFGQGGSNRPDMELLDADGHVCAVLHYDDWSPRLVFCDPGGQTREAFVGRLAVAAALFRMLVDPECHPEIVAGGDCPGRLVTPTCRGVAPAKLEAGASRRRAKAAMATARPRRRRKGGGPVKGELRLGPA